MCSISVCVMGSGVEEWRKRFEGAAVERGDETGVHRDDDVCVCVWPSPCEKHSR